MVWFINLGRFGRFLTPCPEWLDWQKKVVAKRKFDIKNIENWFGGAKIGGESLPLAPDQAVA